MYMTAPDMTNPHIFVVWLCFASAFGEPLTMQYHPEHANSSTFNIIQITRQKEFEETLIPAEYLEDKHNSDQVTDCPYFCTCTVNPLMIKDCAKNPRNDLDPLLKDHLNSTSLAIINSSLTRLPLFVCNMTKLRSIDVSTNLLEDLPWGCLKHLQHLSHIKASRNKIKRLENGSFYDFPALRSLELSHNQISEIDVDVFLQTKRLQLINYINLYNNSIVSLDPWPLRFLEGNQIINLEHNKISRFTNRFNWNFTCQDGKPSARTSLVNNKITHVSDMFDGWNIKTDRDVVICIFFNYGILKLNYNPYICDCIDYNLYRYFHQIKQSSYFDYMFCQKPLSLLHHRIVSLNLDHIICHVKENCPKECDCINQPNQMKMIINCELTDTYDLPLSLPKLPKLNSRYQLNFSHANITHLSYRSYLSHTRAAIFSYNKIRNISVKAINALSKADKVYLDGNDLTYLPENISMVNMSQVKEMYLEKNKWICDCHAKETRAWMIQMNKTINDRRGILCEQPSRNKGKNLLLLKEDDLICGNPPNEKSITYVRIGVSSICIVTLAIVGALIFKKCFNKKSVWQHFDRDECEGENKEFDVFVSYANENKEYVEEDLIKSLEKRGYKVAYHRVNFPGGTPIHVSIEKCINKSKRTLAVLSNEYLKSDWCMWELTVALELDKNKNTHRMLTIKFEDVDVNSLDLTLQAYFNRYTYLLHNAPMFWENLEYSLPQNKMGTQDVQEGNGENCDGHNNGDDLPSLNSELDQLVVNH